ncbi:MAG: hypothetical protein K9G38_04960 [Bacteroidales bacterium]|nr:hypothetical protein [Bacteroidales bacterium]
MDQLAHIRALLDRFYEGMTSREEEQELERYFSEENDVPAEWSADREMFLSMAGLQKPADIPDGLDEKIMSRISAVQKNETRGRRIGIYSFSGLAAGLLIILSVYLGIVKDQGNHLQQYAVEDPELAYAEAKKALMMVSSRWNEGTAELSNLEQVNKGIESVSTMRKLSSGSRELNLLGNLEKANDIEL